MLYVGMYLQKKSNGVIKISGIFGIQTKHINFSHKCQQFPNRYNTEHLNPEWNIEKISPNLLRHYWHLLNWPNHWRGLIAPLSPSLSDAEARADIFHLASRQFFHWRFELRVISFALVLCRVDVCRMDVFFLHRFRMLCGWMDAVDKNLKEFLFESRNCVVGSCKSAFRENHDFARVFRARSPIVRNACNFDPNAFVDIKTMHACLIPW
jgi:hypothetical protein